MKTLLLIALMLTLPVVAAAGPETNSVPLTAKALIAYLESELSYPNEEKIDLKIKKIERQIELLNHVTNAQSPELWLYRHDKLEYLAGCLYLELGNGERAYRHLKRCYWNCGRYDTRAGKLLKQHFSKKDSNKSIDLDKE